MENFDEEKKDLDGGEEEEEEEDDEELTDLPQEVKDDIADKGLKFENETDLQEYLEKRGLGDLKVVLVDQRPRRIMPTQQHHVFTGNYARNFELKWGKNKWGCAANDYNVYLQNRRIQEPDLSFFGYPNCTRGQNGTIKPVNKIPDVVIQFSWKNTLQYESKAINDMMNCGLEMEGGNLSTTCPRVGYLIKVCFSKKRKLVGDTTQDIQSLDVYKMPHGTTVDDAIMGVKGAEKWNYAPGKEDRKILIRPDDLGISGFWAKWCSDYEIPSSEMFSEMNEFHTSQQRKGLQ